MLNKYTKHGERLITCGECLVEGLSWLIESEPKFSMAADLTGPLPLRLRQDGFKQVLHTIISQQLSLKSAKAIWLRLEKVGIVTPAAIKLAGDDALRKCGLSKQKIGYLRALSESNLDYLALREMETNEVINTLTKISGIGVWTAEIYAMFSLGRADIFPAGDLALKQGARLLFDLDDKPSENKLRTISDYWSPWRTVAAQLLWAYYSNVKIREGVK